MVSVFIVVVVNGVSVVWVLRKILKKKEGTLVSRLDLDTFGFDSVMVIKTHTVNREGLQVFRLEFAENQTSFQEFIA